ncbi:MAG: gliding motility-associated protein GldE [Cyclobacteriaceae bacterium]
MDEPPGYLLLFISLEPGILYIILAALLIFLTSLASATEAAFFSLHADDLERLRNSNVEEEKNVAELQTNPRLLLTTLTALKYSMISGSAVIFIFFLFGNEHPYTTATILLGTITLTIAFTFFGVIIPKIYGKANNLSIAKRSANICKRLIVFYKPLLTPLFKMSYKVEGKLEKLYEQSSAEELNQALQLANANNETSESEKDILQGIVNFGSLTVKQVMRLRSDISFADISANFIGLLEVVKRSGYSRIPVCRNNLDKIEGVLYIKDLLPFLSESPAFPWQKLIRPAYFALETRKIDQLLKDFQEKRVHLALVVDEYGILTGLITLEDIIEEIIGDINDEFDEIGSHFQKLDNRTFIFDGKTSMHDFCKILQVEGAVFNLAKSANKSLGAMLRQIHGSVPKTGEPVVVKPFTFVVEKMDNRRIKKVRVKVHGSREN